MFGLDETIQCYREVTFPRVYEVIDARPTSNYVLAGTVVPTGKVFVYGAFEGHSLVYTPPPPGWVWYPTFIPRQPNFPKWYLDMLEAQRRIAEEKMNQQTSTTPVTPPSNNIYNEDGTINISKVKIAGD
jgi:hypothetical protein